MSRVLVVATRNQKKAGEMITILRGLLGDRWEIKTLADFPDFEEPEESGETYAQNAVIKAEAAVKATGQLCIADDAGLEIDALGGLPGVHSKRFEGETLPFPEKIRIILDRVNGKPRSARFRCAVAIASPNSKSELFESTKEGVISESPVGTGGFGYDAIFYLPELGKTFAELQPEQKNRISHRGIVLRKAVAWLRNV